MFIGMPYVYFVMFQLREGLTELARSFFMTVSGSKATPAYGLLSELLLDQVGTQISLKGKLPKYGFVKLGIFFHIKTALLATHYETAAQVEKHIDGHLRQCGVRLMAAYVHPPYVSVYYCEHVIQ